MAAFAVSNSKSAVGAYYRRLRARLGAPKAITATAHKLARILYNMLKHTTDYVDQGQDSYERQYRERALKNIRRRAAEFGYSLVQNATEELAALNT